MFVLTTTFMKPIGWLFQNIPDVFSLQVVSINMSCLEAHFNIYRLFMKGKFNVIFVEKLDFLTSNSR